MSWRIIRELPHSEGVLHPRNIVDTTDRVEEGQDTLVEHQGHDARICDRNGGDLESLIDREWGTQPCNGVKRCMESTHRIEGES